MHVWIFHWSQIYWILPCLLKMKNAPTILKKCELAYSGHIIKNTKLALGTVPHSNGSLVTKL